MPVLKILVACIIIGSIVFPNYSIIVEEPLADDQDWQEQERESILQFQLNEPHKSMWE